MFAKELTIEELRERWEWLKIEFGVERLRVVERFKKEKTFNVYGLSMDIEGDHICCSDYYNELIDQNSVLIGFLKSSVKTIKLLRLSNDLYQEQIVFDSGEILIETNKTII